MSAACPRVHLEYSLQLVKHRAHERLQHHDEEYGGPFGMEVSPKMKIDDLRKAIAEKCGIMPGMQKLSFAGKNFEDSQRTLEQCVPLPPLPLRRRACDTRSSVRFSPSPTHRYGVKYWNAKFPHWPLTLRRH